jgi:hypothetical protein
MIRRRISQMRKPRAKTRLYAIYYKDNSYMTYELTEADYNALTKAIDAKMPVKLSVGQLVTEDIRAVIIQKEQPKVETKPDKPAVPDLSVEEMTYLKAVLSGTYEEDMQ